MLFFVIVSCNDMNPIENIWSLFETFMRTFQKHFKKKF